MAYVPAPNVVEFRLRGLYYDQQVENVLTFQHTAGAIPPESLLTWAEDLSSGWQSEYLPNIAVAYQHLSTLATDLTTQTSPSVTWAVVPPVAGGAPAEGAPGSVSLAISFGTINRGRSSRGRMFVVGLPESQIVGNLVEQAYVSTLLQGFVGFIAFAEATAPLSHVVTSRYSNGNPRTTALVQPVLSYTIKDRVVDSQRRRLPGRGR